MLKKFILDICTKTSFTFNDKVYEQKDGVIMGASLGPVLANIIMTECENVVVSKLIKKGTIKFYIRYADDTLLLVKRKDIQKVVNEFDKFDKHLKVTVDSFENEILHFLDLEIRPNGLTIYRKDTHTGQYVNINSYTPWKWRIAWIRSLTNRATKICSKENLANELSAIKKFASWNGYPKHIVNNIIKRSLTKKKTITNENEKLPVVYINVDFTGDKGEHLLTQAIKKLRRCTNQKVIFKTCYSVTKLSFFTNTKDRLNMLSKSSVVYQFKCPGCNSSYIGKTDRTMFVRTKEHAKRNDSAIHNHITHCPGVDYLFGINNLLHNDVDSSDFKINLVRDNTIIIDQSKNWNILLFKEAFHIKQKSSCLNNGVKASRELQLF